ncbi:MAG: COG2426 family protein [Candidatus Fimadaptatus sp.]|jgi:uncharacterized membrane protein
MSFLTEMSAFLKVMLVSMLPIIEVKGAIPMGLLWGLNGWEAFIAAVLGSSIPVPFIMLLLKPALRWLRSLPYKPCHVYADWFERRAMKKKGRISEKSLIFLFLFVAIPIPTTGVWMGSAIATLLDIRIKYALPIILLGNVVASLILVALGVLVI